MKLSKLPDRNPVRITFSAMPDLNAALQAYAEAYRAKYGETASVPALPELPGAISRQLSTPATAIPRAHLLSNGQYSVMLTNAGGGYSACRSLAVTAALVVARKVLRRSAVVWE